MLLEESFKICIIVFNVNLHDGKGILNKPVFYISIDVCIHLPSINKYLQSLRNLEWLFFLDLCNSYSIKAK